MANNDDLFAGLTIGAKQVPNQQQQAVKKANLPVDNADLFAGLIVGQQQIPETDPIQQQVTPAITPTTAPTVGGLTEIQPLQDPKPPTDEPEESGFFESAGDFLSNIDLSSVSDLFTGKSRETEISKRLPEISGISSGDFGADLKISAGLLASANEDDQIDIIKTAVPNSKFFRDEKNNIIVEMPNGDRAVLNQPGFSFQDAIQATATVLSFLPSTALAGIGKTLAQKVAIGSIGAGATQAGLQQTAKEFGAERDLDKSEIATAAVFGGVGELIVPAVQAVRSARQAKKFGVERAEVAAAKEAIRPAQEVVAKLESVTGQNVGLFPAQQTQLPTSLLKQRLLPQLDAGAQKAASSLERQNKEAFDATSELLNTIAGPEVTETAAKRFRSAAQNALQSSKDRRSAATRDLFNSALDEGAAVNVNPVRDLIKQNLDDAPQGGEIIRTMNKIQNFIKPKDVAGETIEPTLRQLQKAKFEVDNMLEKFGENALGNTTKRDVVQLKKLLVNQMEEASPLYKQANEEFARLSPAVKDLEDTIIGAVSKVKDLDLQNISRRIFSPSSNSKVVKDAKAIIDSADPGAWDDMLRTELQRRFGGIETLSEDIPGELVGNVPGQLRRAIFGNPEQRRTLLSAMNQDQRQNFVYLDNVLKRASSGRQAGSPTAPFGEVLDRLKGVAGVVRDMILRPLETLQKTGERGIFDKNVAALTEVMFNPNFQPRLRELRQLNPDSPAAARALIQLINTAEVREDK